MIQTKKTAATRKLHSVHSLLIGKEFTGEIATGKKFSYSPSSIALTSGKIELTGRFSVKTAGQIRKAESVKATLLATQGNIQSPPPTPAGAAASMLGEVQPSDKPATDATGSRASVGVMYFKLSSLKGADLGLQYDLSNLQLNVRLNPTDDAARTLQFWFSVAVRAVLGEAPNSASNSALTVQAFNEINKLLRT